MEHKMMYDITAVCNMLGITSRTLRFYEEKGLVESTKEFSNRRKYTNQQVEIIKKILVLRSLGLSVSKIQAIQKGDSDLKIAIIEHKAEIIAKLTAKSKEIRLLDDALSTISDGGDIFDENRKNKIDAILYNKTVSRAVDDFIKGDYESVFQSFTEKMQAYTPLSALKRITEDTLLTLGKFITLEKTVADSQRDNIFYSYLRYEKLGLCIKFVLHGEKISGLWFSYYEV